MVSKEIRKTPEIYYVGNSISSTYLKHLMDVVGDRDFSVNIISKSGTTTEPAIAFRIFKEMLERKYGKEEAAKRIYATTDKARGALKNLAAEEGYETFVVPDDVGGRFSVLTAVGLLPIAVSGADIEKLMEGAASARERAIGDPYESNDAVLYAAIRNILHRKGKSIEILANYEPSLHYVSEWWKQLCGESEGKDQKMCIRDRPKPVPFCLWVMNGSNIVDRSSGAMPQPVSDIVITTCWFWKAADKEMAA